MKRILILFLVIIAVAAASASAAVLPPEGISAGYLAFTGRETKRAVVLCESLSVCDARGGRDYQYARSLKTADSSPDNSLVFDLFK